MHIKLDAVFADDFFQLVGKQLRGGQDDEFFEGGLGSLILGEHEGH